MKINRNFDKDEHTGQMVKEITDTLDVSKELIYNCADMILMIGLPLSGKSNYAKRLQKEDGYTIVCPDTIRLALHGQQFEPLSEPFVWAIAQTMVRTLLKDGHRVVIDATNTTKERRKMWVNIAKELDVTICGYWIATSKEECIRRNNEIKRLDNKIIERMDSQFEEPDEIKLSQKYCYVKRYED